jgi:uncharacterized protein (TIGR02271 family)
MAATQRSTVVGVFHDRHQANLAVEDLKRAGFRDDQIGVAGRHTDTTTDATTEGSGSMWEEGAITGALAGAGLGGLVGLGIIAGLIPAVGPVIAGGTLAAILANAAGGAALAGLAGALIGAGIPEDEARYYESEFHSGRIIVTVKANGRYTEAESILRKHGAYDMQTAGASQAAVTTSTAPRTTAAMGTCTTGTSKAGGDQTIELHEEKLQAHTQPVAAGEVRVHKDVITEHKTIDVPVTREEVVIERHPASGKASSSDIRQGEEIRIPVKEEQVRVDKETVVKEEVTVGKRKVQDTEHVSGDVRREEVRVEQKGDVDVCDPGTGGTKNRK